MIGLSGARVVLLDDQPNEAIPVIKAFSRMGVPVAFFDGKTAGFPTKKNKLRGVRLAILDMNLGVTGSNETIASTLVQTFSRIIDDNNGPYGILIWTNHPDLKELVARYIFEHPSLPNPVFVVMLTKAEFTVAGGRELPRRFALERLSTELVRILGENSPLECMQVWEGTCFKAATNVTNSLAALGASTATNLDEWRLAWRTEALKLLSVISKASAEQHHTRENCIPSILLALNPLHSDRMDVLVEEVHADLTTHADHIMAATGGSNIERKAKVNSMLHLASDQLDSFNPGNLFVFNKRIKPSFMPTLRDVLLDCIEGSDAQQAANLALILEHGLLCGVELTPICDHAQNKMGFSRIIAGIVVPSEHIKKVKKGQFLKSVGTFYFDTRPFRAGTYVIFLNSRYLASAKLVVVKRLTAAARLRPQLLGDVQSWASYQAARQGVMMLG